MKGWCRLVLTLIAVGLVFAPFVWADDLRVSGTVPACGDARVAPLPGKLTISFSGPVKMNSYSFVETDEGDLPEVTGDPIFPDNQTCVLPVRLRAGTTYSLGINSATRSGFKSAGDETVAVAPYVLTFTTAAQADAPAQAAPPAAAPEKPAATQRPAGALAETLVLQRVAEPRENAFTFLLPRGWTVEGGITRVNPLTQGGPGNSIAAKLDMVTKKDPQGTVMSRALPDTLFMDMTASPAGQMGLFPTGSNYNGMLVVPRMSAVNFLVQIAFPYAHPQVTDAQATEQKPLPDVAQAFLQRTQSMLGQYAATFSYDAAFITVTYTENGTRYKEKLVAVVEDYGQLGAGLWGNKETGLIRAPADEFDRWEPVFSVMRRSVILNPEWARAELRGQMERSQIVLDTQREIQRIDREIVEHRQKTNEEINNDMFLTLTDQEEYVNPYTDKVEVGSNQWAHRWQNENGDVIYTDAANYDPNADPNLNLSGFKQSEIRKRFPN